MLFKKTFLDENTKAKYYRCETAALITDEGITLEIPGHLTPTLIPFSHDLFQTNEIQFVNGDMKRNGWANNSEKAKAWLKVEKTEIEDDFYIRAVIWFDLKVFYKTKKAQIGKRSLEDLVTSSNIIKMVKVDIKQVTLLAEPQPNTD